MPSPLITGLSLVFRNHYPPRNEQQLQLPPTQDQNTQLLRPPAVAVAALAFSQKNAQTQKLLAVARAVSYPLTLSITTAGTLPVPQLSQTTRELTYLFFAPRAKGTTKSKCISRRQKIPFGGGWGEGREGRQEGEGLLVRVSGEWPIYVLPSCCACSVLDACPVIIVF